MNRRRKSKITQAKIGCHNTGWQRCGDSFFHSNTGDSSLRSSSGIGHDQRPAFGHKWIQSEDLMFSGISRAPGQDISSTYSKSGGETAESDVDSEEITLSESPKSDDWKEKSADQGPALIVTQRVRKRKQCTRGVCKRRKSACVRTLLMASGSDCSDSDTCEIVSASESEGDDVKNQTGDGETVVFSGDIPPDQKIEFPHSPAQPGESSPDCESQSAHEIMPLSGAETESSPQKPLDGGTPTVSNVSSSQITTQDSDGSPGTLGVRASEWVKQLHWQTTPTKSPRDACPEPEVDSAKKKRKRAKKYSKDGMAEQLVRLITREKSASNMWLHQQAAGEGSQGSSARCLAVKVTSLETAYSLHAARCMVIENCTDNRISDAHCVVVLFSHFLAQQVSLLRPGCTVKIFPPWQQLSLAKEKVIFCNRFLLDSSQPSGLDCLQVHGQQSLGQLNASLFNKEHIFGKWACPCSKDYKIKSEDCRAHRHPFMAGSLEQFILAENTEARPSSGHMLHTVACSCKPSKRTLAFDTLLESIEKTRPGDKTLPSFRATVIRVFHWRDPETKKDRCELLVEDSQGTVAVIQGAENCLLDNTHLLESCVYCFTGFQVKSRTNKDKDPALFSVVEAAWSARSKGSGSMSQDSGSAENSQGISKPPPFCYILEGESASDVLSGHDTIFLDDPKPCVSFIWNAQLIANVIKGSCSSCRVSFVGKVLYASFCSQQPSVEGEGKNLAEVFVVDSSLSDKHITSYVKVCVGAGCITDDIQLSASGGGDVPYVALFVDVWFTHDRWLADKYSALCRVDSHTETAKTRLKGLSTNFLQAVQDCKVCLPLLSPATPVNTLVQISGIIQNIDEKSAITWDECDSCGSDHLGTISGTGATVCVKCKKTVKGPVQRMRMDAFVQDDNLKSVVKISLLQSTIQQILPEEDDEEGYDVGSVLNKQVGPLNCVITSLGNKTTHPVARQIF